MPVQPNTTNIPAASEPNQSLSPQSYRVVLSLLGLGADAPHLHCVDVEPFLAGELARVERGARGRREAVAEVAAQEQTKVLKLAAETLPESDAVIRVSHPSAGWVYVFGNDSLRILGIAEPQDEGKGKKWADTTR